VGLFVHMRVGVCLVVKRQPLTLPILARLEHYWRGGPRSQRARIGHSVVAGSIVKHYASNMCPLMLTLSQQLLVADAMQCGLLVLPRKCVRRRLNALNFIVPG
jgi:hypothetical protein